MLVKSVKPILSLILVSLGVYLLTGCGVPPNRYDVRHNYTTMKGYKLDIREVKVSVQWIYHLDRVLEMKNDCLVERGYRPLNKEKLILKFVEQTCFSPCSPKEQFLCDEAPQELCSQKGLKPNPDCPCRWRTIDQDRWHVIIPMVSGVTEVPSLNLWHILTVNTWLYIWDKNITECIFSVSDVDKDDCNKN